MNLSEVLKITNDLIDETDIDEQIESIIKNAINYAYLIIASKIDRRSISKELTYSKFIKVPNDFVSVIDMLGGDEILTSDDYSIKGDTIIFHTKRFSSVTMIYNKTTLPLVNPTDILDIDDRYCFACAMYGAYAYSVHRKRTELASILLSDFNNLIKSDSAPVKMEVNVFESSRSN